MSVKELRSYNYRSGNSTLVVHDDLGIKHANEATDDNSKDREEVYLEEFVTMHILMKMENFGLATDVALFGCLIKMNMK
ncbi:3585_t:CDS:2 [Gigaspora rosea]|nr:3585_t:CDS:2 [Gigaspora rosea]